MDLIGDGVGQLVELERGLVADDRLIRTRGHPRRGDVIEGRSREEPDAVQPACRPLEPTAGARVIGKGIAVNAKLASLARGEEAGLTLRERPYPLPIHLVTHLPDCIRHNCDRMPRGRRRASPTP